jgi:hypothetical protein
MQMRHWTGHLSAFPMQSGYIEIDFANRVDASE